MPFKWPPPMGGLHMGIRDMGYTKGAKGYIGLKFIVLSWTPIVAPFSPLSAGVFRWRWSAGVFRWRWSAGVRGLLSNHPGSVGGVLNLCFFELVISSVAM